LQPLVEQIYREVSTQHQPVADKDPRFAAPQESPES
jgi:hypothetical protein